MSITPVLAVVPASDPQSREPQPRPHAAESSPQGLSKVSDAVPGTSPKRENPSDRSTTVSLEMPQDVVQVQRDSQVRDMIIIKYLDHATGEVILQVPSAQVVGVSRGIYEDFRQRAERQNHPAATQDAEGEHHGH